MPKSVFTDAYKVMLDALIKARKESGVTQVELADRLGKPQPWVSNVETGVRRIDFIEFVAIIRALGIESEEFISKTLSSLPSDLEI